MENNKNKQIQSETIIVSLYNYEYWQERLKNCSSEIKINNKSIIAKI